MAFISADRVKETTETTGTGAITLAGASAGFRSFASVMSAADTCHYCIVGNNEWEVGLGTYNTTLARTSVIASSNAGSAVNFSAGTKDVFITLNQQTILSLAAAVIHSHAISDVTGLQTALDAKLDDSQLDTDTTLAANSDSLIATQKAVKAYVDANAGASGSITASGYTMATDKLLGRDTAGTGAIEEIGLGRGLVFDGTNVNVTLVTGSASGNDPNPVSIPVVSSFSWVNQGAATASDGVAGLGILLTNDCDGEHHILETNAPSTPFDVYARFSPLMLEATSSGNAANQPSIILRDSSSGKFISLQTEQVRATSALQYRVQISRWTNPTTFSAGPVVYFGHQYYPWIRANVTSTTITFYMAFAGQWIQIGTETIATFVGAIDKVGFSMRSDTGIDFAYCAIGNFGFTDPLA